MTKQGRTTGRNKKATWKEAVDSALTSLDNQSPRLDVYKKESISGDGALWLALISPSSPNQALLSLLLFQYDNDDSRRDEGHLHRWSRLMWSFTCSHTFQALTFTNFYTTSTHTIGSPQGILFCDLFPSSSHLLNPVFNNVFSILIKWLRFYMLFKYQDQLSLALSGHVSSTFKTFISFFRCHFHAC